MLRKIWEQYLFKEALKVFFFFIISFYFLYVLIDYSVHIKSFTYAQFSTLDIISYYACHFTKRAGIILPFALMLATIKVLTSLTNKRELVALLAGGISLQKILQPFIALSLISISFLYINAEFFLPKADDFLRGIEKGYIESKLDVSSPSLFSIQMIDGSTLVFQNYDTRKKAFYDAFWIQDSDHIIRIKYLYPGKAIPKGEFVDFLTRNKNGQFTKESSFEEKLFPTLHLEQEAIQESITPIASEPLSWLVKELFRKNKQPLEEKGELIANLSYKIFMPLLSLIVILIPAPYCLRFSRNLPVFFIYCLSIFGFVVLITIMDAAFILAENQLASPIFILLLPIACASILAIFQYLKLRKI